VKSFVTRKIGLVTVALPLMLGPHAAFAEESWPTLERTAYMLHCMGEHGGQTMDNLYSCACVVDKVMRELTLEEYTEIQTFIQYKRMPGDKGGIFRDQPRAEELLAKQQQLEAAAEKVCFIKHKEVQLKEGEKAPMPEVPAIPAP